MIALEEILAALSISRGRPDTAPDQPGLYAIFGSPEVWNELGLGAPPDARPLYVGKAEKSLLGRDVRQHFGTGSTGSSTVRRTLAALLKEKHRYVGVPRNPKNPGHFAMYSIAREQDETLTYWMQRSLLLGTWVPAEEADLGALETEVLLHWGPPMNLSKVKTPWLRRIKKLRKAMAEEARRYS